jgi:hypothetical protein
MVLLAKSDAAQDPSARLLLMLFALKMHLALPLFLHFVKVARQRRVVLPATAKLWSWPLRGKMRKGRFQSVLHIYFDSACARCG